LDAYVSFRSRDYRFLLSGAFLASFGLQMLSVAVSWDLYLQTRSALVLGNVGLVQVAPYLLFALYAGGVADKYPRRSILVVTQVLYLAASAVLMLSHSVAAIYCVLFFLATARSFQGPARGALLQRVVGADALTNAITWNSSAMEIANVSGPALGGIVLAAFGSRSVYLIQVACAILTFGCFLALRTRGEPETTAHLPERGRLLEGIRFVLREKLILSAITLDLFAVLFGGATALLPIFAVDILHAGVRALGWLRAAPSIGAVIMAITLAHGPGIHRAGRALLIAVAGFGAAMIVFGVSKWLPLSFVMLVLTGAFDNVSVVLRSTLVQTRTPDQVRGRVLAVNNIFISCSNQLGAVESGWTAAWLGAIWSVAGGGAATILVVLISAAVSPTLRRWRQGISHAEPATIPAK
jgi:MFS family permease